VPPPTPLLLAAAVALLLLALGPLPAAVAQRQDCTARGAGCNTAEAPLLRPGHHRRLLWGSLRIANQARALQFSPGVHPPEMGGEWVGMAGARALLSSKHNKKHHKKHHHTKEDEEPEPELSYARPKPKGAPAPWNLPNSQHKEASVHKEEVPEWVPPTARQQMPEAGSGHVSGARIVQHAKIRARAEKDAFLARNLKPRVESKQWVDADTGEPIDVAAQNRQVAKSGILGRFGGLGKVARSRDAMHQLSHKRRAESGTSMHAGGLHGRRRLLALPAQEVGGALWDPPGDSGGGRRELLKADSMKKSFHPVGKQINVKHKPKIDGPGLRGVHATVPSWNKPHGAPAEEGGGAAKAKAKPKPGVRTLKPSNPFPEGIAAKATMGGAVGAAMTGKIHMHVHGKESYGAHAHGKVGGGAKGFSMQHAMSKAQSATSHHGRRLLASVKVDDAGRVRKHWDVTLHSLRPRRAPAGGAEADMGHGRAAHVARWV